LRSLRGCPRETAAGTAAQKTLLKALAKLWELAEKGSGGAGEREQGVSSVLRNEDRTKIAQLAERGCPSEPEEGTSAAPSVTDS